MRTLYPTALTRRMRAHASEHALPVDHPLCRAADALEYAASKPECPRTLRRAWMRARTTLRRCEVLYGAGRR